MIHLAQRGEPKKGTFLAEPTHHFSSGESSAPVLFGKNTKATTTTTHIALPASFRLLSLSGL